MTRRRHFVRLLLVIAAVVFLNLALAPAATADTATYYVTTPNAGLCGNVTPCSSPPPYATVIFSTNGSGGINVTVNMSGAYLMFGNGGGTAAFAFNAVSGLNITLSAASVAAGFSYPGGTNMDGFGSGVNTFTYGINGPNAGHAQSTLTFTITCGTSGCTSLNSVADLGLFANSLGLTMALHVLDPKTGNTGYATVPEPGTIGLLALGLVGLVGWRRFGRT